MFAVKIHKSPNKTAINDRTNWSQITEKFVSAYKTAATLRMASSRDMNAVDIKAVKQRRAEPPGDDLRHRLWLRPPDLLIYLLFMSFRKVGAAHFMNFRMPGIIHCLTAKLKSSPRAHWIRNSKKNIKICSIFTLLK